MAREEFLTAEQSVVARGVLQRLRDEIGSQKAMEPVVGVAQQTISRILRGGPVGLRVATSMAERGLIDLTELLTGKPAADVPARMVDPVKRYESAGDVGEMLMGRAWCPPGGAGKWAPPAVFAEPADGSSVGDLYKLARKALKAAHKDPRGSVGDVEADAEEFEPRRKR